MQHTTTQDVVQLETCVKNRTTIRSDYFFGRFRLSVIKDQMTLIGHNMSAKWDAIRPENLEKLKLITTIRALAAVDYIMSISFMNQ